MKKHIAILAGLVIASAAFAQVDPSKPMVTGKGNVDVRPAPKMVTNQTAPAADDSVKLDKFVVTGSLLPHPAKKVVKK